MIRLREYATMPCFILLLALITPRFALVLMWLFSDYLGRAYATVLWPLLGFFIMPMTTIAYAVCLNEGGGLRDGWIALFVVAVLIDFGVVGGTARGRRER